MQWQPEMLSFEWDIYRNIAQTGSHGEKSAALWPRGYQHSSTYEVAHYVLPSGFSATLTTTLSTPVFRNPPPSAITHSNILSNQLSMTPDHTDWGMSKMTPWMNAQAYWYTQVASPVTMSPTLEDPPPNFLSMWLHQSTLPHFCSSLRSWGTNRPQRFCTPRQSRKMRVRLPDEMFMNYFFFSVCHFGVLLNQRLYPRDVFCGNGRCHSTTTVIVFQLSRSRHELSEPPENSGFGRRLIFKTVF